MVPGRRRCWIDRGRAITPALLLLLGLAVGGCEEDEFTDPEVELTAFIRANHDIMAMPEQIPYPDDNPAITERIELGRLLFFDPILSGDRDVSCAHCHHPAFAWADGRDLSIGVGGEGLGPDRVRTIGDAPTEFFTPRNSPSILDTAFNRPFSGDAPHEGRMFWDGRETTLEAQALAPIRSRDEMRHDAYLAPEALTRVLLRLQDIPEYVDLFAAAFPDVAETAVQMGDARLVINGDTYSRAIAAYERELCTADSPFDQFVRGDDSALSYAQKRGLDLFWKSGCRECHSGPMFSDFSFRVTGVQPGGAGKPPIHEGGDGTDPGRYLQTAVEADRDAFRTPTLRNVALTAPYFHTGGADSGGDYQTLRQTVEFYDRGANDEGLPLERLDPSLRPLGLTPQEIDDLVAFLESLTATRLASDRVDPTVPAEVPSGLEPPEVLPPVLTW